MYTGVYISTTPLRERFRSYGTTGRVGSMTHTHIARSTCYFATYRPGGFSWAPITRHIPYANPRVLPPAVSAASTVSNGRESDISPANPTASHSHNKEGLRDTPRVVQFQKPNKASSSPTAPSFSTVAIANQPSGETQSSERATSIQSVVSIQTRNKTTTNGTRIYTTTRVTATRCNKTRHGCSATTSLLTPNVFPHGIHSLHRKGQKQIT